MSPAKNSQSARGTAAKMRQAAVRRQRWMLLGILGIASAAIAVGVTVVTQKWNQASSIAITKEAATPNHWPAVWARKARIPALGQKIDGIPCETMEGTAEHTHQHLTLIVDGKVAYAPASSGINDSAQCLYWLHTHSPDGIIHLESPVKHPFMLGEFLDIWRSTPSVDRSLLTDVIAKQKPTQVWLNGNLYTGNPWTIPLTPQAQIAIEYGQPTIKPKPFTFPKGL